MVRVAGSGGLKAMVLLGTVGTMVAIGAVSLHIGAGMGLPPDAARALSVQVPITACGLLLALHRPRNRLGPLALSAGALVGLGLLAVGILRFGAAGGSVPDLVEHAAFMGVQMLGWPLTAVWLLALLAFPGGTPPPASARPWWVAAVAAHGVVAIGGYVTAGRADLPAYLGGLVIPVGGGPFPSAAAHVPFAIANNVLLLAVPAGGVAALLVWRRRSGPIARQQLKWLLPALALQLVVHLAVPTSADPWNGWRAAGEVVLLAAPALGAAAVAVAVFKYRLWEIDTVISKALVFALLSAVVTLGFLVIAGGAAVLVGGAEVPVLAAVVVVLAAIVASQGPRRRAERAVRRWVYGERPRGFAVLGGLSESLASARGAGDVAERIVDAVRRGLSVPWASVWLHVDDAGRSSLQLVATSGTGPGMPMAAASIVLPHAAATALAASPRAELVDRLPEPVTSLLRPVRGGEPAAVAPLVAGRDLVGLVACGDRFREPLQEDDLELLGLVARDAGLGLANRRLEAELGLRLADLRRSRQRLVSAQDAERRRVERDLHDGVQAQLVALAVKVRRLSTHPDRATSANLAAVATEVEEALFALQDLARGIFPSVLTDRGLPAALRTHAARLPLDVHLSVEASLADRRMPSDVEAALYFVALEALANVHKHAVDARVTTALRLDAGRCVVLDVSDDGPGFDRSAPPGEGSGLLNMADRMEAIGGTLAVRSSIGSGSQVVARAPLQESW